MPQRDRIDPWQEGAPKYGTFTSQRLLFLVYPMIVDRSYEGVARIYRGLPTRLAVVTP